VLEVKWSVIDKNDKTDNKNMTIMEQHLMEWHILPFDVKCKLKLARYLTATTSAVSLVSRVLFFVILLSPLHLEVDLSSLSFPSRSFFLHVLTIGHDTVQPFSCEISLCSAFSVLHFSLCLFLAYFVRPDDPIACRTGRCMPSSSFFFHSYITCPLSSFNIARNAARLYDVPSYVVLARQM